MSKKNILFLVANALGGAFFIYFVLRLNSVTLGHTNLNTTQRYLHYDFEKMHNLYKMQYHL